MRERKALAILLAVCMVLTMNPLMGFAGGEDLTVSNHSRFPDVTGHWAANQINKWADLGLIKGDERGFRPDDPITRAEMAAILEHRVLKNLWY
jgi:hypothetical protein